MLTGGRARPDLGPYFYEPTILEGVTPEMTCFGDETFGPVISLYRFHDEADAVARANDGEYGLNASIYSQDGARGRAIARADQVRHGQHQRGVRRDLRAASTRRWAACASPGMGRRQGAEGILRYTESQSVGDPAADPVRARCSACPTSTYAKVMTASLRLMKKLGRT